MGARPVAEHAHTEIHNLKTLDIETPERGPRRCVEGPSPYARRHLLNPTNTRHRTIEWSLAGPSLIPGVTAWRSSSGCLALVGREDGKWHVSVSHPKREPSWDEMRAARERFTPDEVTMAMILPPRAEYVNVHETCLHLWQVEP